MSGSERQEPEADGAVLEVEPACTELVPLTAASAQRSWSHGPRRRWLPDPIFVTHLIATAERAPQTRSLHRATFADAQTAYHAGQSPVRGAGTRTRQII
jgi:hypothetical protein